MSYVISVSEIKKNNFFVLPDVWPDLETAQQIMGSRAEELIDELTEEADENGLLGEIAFVLIPDDSGMCTNVHQARMDQDGNFTLLDHIAHIELTHVTIR